MKTRKKQPSQKKKKKVRKNSKRPRATSRNNKERNNKLKNDKKNKKEEGTTDDVTNQQKKKSYYLVSSSTFFSQYLYWLTFNIFILQAILTNRYLKEKCTIVYDYILYQAMSFSHQLGAWIIISLLSSSCCAFQLILNCFSIGCAGLNSVLGPMRPFFVSIVTITQTWQFLSIEKEEQYLRAYISILVTSALTFLPEILFYYIKYKDHRNASKEEKNRSNTDEKANVSEYKLKIEGMNCIACVQTIKNTIESTKGVVGHSTVVLETGEAFVKTNTWENTVPLLTTRINDIGFSANINNVEKVLIRPDEITALSSDDDEKDEVVTRKSKPTAIASVAKTVAEMTMDSTPTTTSISHFTTGILAGLLSSSCCLLQLGLNILSVFDIVHIGCAGFNVILGPLRPYLRFVTLTWLVVLWYHALGNNNNNNKGKITTKNNKKKDDAKNKKKITSYFTQIQKRLFINTIITILLMYMPEGLKLLGGPAIAPPTSNAIKQTYVVDNMGCEACIDAVGRIINQADGVLYSSIELETGEATIYVAKDWNFNSLDLDQHLRHHGYELHEEGHITKKMILDKSLGVKKKNTHSSARVQNGFI